LVEGGGGDYYSPEKIAERDPFSPYASDAWRDQIKANQKKVFTEEENKKAIDDLFTLFEITSYYDITGISSLITGIRELQKEEYVGGGIELVGAIPIAGIFEKAGIKGAKAGASAIAKNADELAEAARFGIKAYKELRKEIKGTGLVAHHVLEKRFADILGEIKAEMKSIALTVEKHQEITNAWRDAIKYGEGTINATKEQVQNAARDIYKGCKDIYKALGL
jgi:hypothetical protein